MTALDNIAVDDGPWRLVFADDASANDERNKERIRRDPRRYPAATMKVIYSMLTAFGALFSCNSFGKYAGILTAPKPNDWLDLAIATTVAHANVLLAEDQRFLRKVNFIGERFGLPIRASSVRNWLASNERRVCR